MDDAATPQDAGLADRGQTGDPTPPVATSFLADLCWRHRGWVVNEVVEDRLPPGWRAAVASSFDKMARFVDGRRYALRRLDAQGTQLHIQIAPVPPVPDGYDTGQWYIKNQVKKLKAQTDWICPTCGERMGLGHPTGIVPCGRDASDRAADRRAGLRATPAVDHGPAARRVGSSRASPRYPFPGASWSKSTS